MMLRVDHDAFFAPAGEWKKQSRLDVAANTVIQTPSGPAGRPLCAFAAKSLAAAWTTKAGGG